MKRLLAAGWGDIWQLCKAFRGGEMGPRHNPEFSILEWYRVGWNWEQLMAEVSDLCATLAGSLLSEGARLARQAPQHLTWREAYQRHCGFDALHAELAEMVACSERLGIPGLENASREEWLDYLMVCAIEPRLGQSGPEFLTAYPAAQAALAQTEVAADGFAWARRFEMYLCGVELCNGYQELSDAAEQARRFATDLELRRSLGKRTPPVDELFLEALRQGMPACSGVALGFDRLAMLLLGLSEIGEGLAFPVQRC